MSVTECKTIFREKSKGRIITALRRPIEFIKSNKEGFKSLDKLSQEYEKKVTDKHTAHNRLGKAKETVEKILNHFKNASTFDKSGMVMQAGRGALGVGSMTSSAVAISGHILGTAGAVAAGSAAGAALAVPLGVTAVGYGAWKSAEAYKKADKRFSNVNKMLAEKDFDYLPDSHRQAWRQNVKTSWEKAPKILKPFAAFNTITSRSEAGMEIGAAKAQYAIASSERLVHGSKTEDVSEKYIKHTKHSRDQVGYEWRKNFFGKQGIHTTSERKSMKAIQQEIADADTFGELYSALVYDAEYQGRLHLQQLVRSPSTESSQNFEQTATKVHEALEMKLQSLTLSKQNKQELAQIRKGVQNRLIVDNAVMNTRKFEIKMWQSVSEGIRSTVGSVSLLRLIPGGIEQLVTAGHIDFGSLVGTTQIGRAVREVKDIGLQLLQGSVFEPTVANAAAFDQTAVFTQKNITEHPLIQRMDSRIALNPDVKQKNFVQAWNEVAAKDGRVTIAPKGPIWQSLDIYVDDKGTMFLRGSEGFGNALKLNIPDGMNGQLHGSIIVLLDTNHSMTIKPIDLINPNNSSGTVQFIKPDGSIGTMPKSQFLEYLSATKNPDSQKGILDNLKEYQQWAIARHKAGLPIGTDYYFNVTGKSALGENVSLIQVENLQAREAHAVNYTMLATAQGHGQHLKNIDVGGINPVEDIKLPSGHGFPQNAILEITSPNGIPDTYVVQVNGNTLNLFDTATDPKHPVVTNLEFFPNLIGSNGKPVFAFSDTENIVHTIPNINGNKIPLTTDDLKPDVNFANNSPIQFIKAPNDTNQYFLFQDPISYHPSPSTFSYYIYDQNQNPVAICTVKNNILEVIRVNSSTSETILIQPDHPTVIDMQKLMSGAKVTSNATPVAHPTPTPTPEKNNTGQVISSKGKGMNKTSFTSWLELGLAGGTAALFTAAGVDRKFNKQRIAKKVVKTVKDIEIQKKLAHTGENFLKLKDNVTTTVVTRARRLRKHKGNTAVYQDLSKAALREAKRNLANSAAKFSDINNIKTDFFQELDTIGAQRGVNGINLYTIANDLIRQYPDLSKEESLNKLDEYLGNPDHNSSDQLESSVPFSQPAPSSTHKRNIGKEITDALTVAVVTLETVGGLLKEKLVSSIKRDKTEPNNEPLIINIPREAENKGFDSNGNKSKGETVIESHIVPYEDVKTVEMPNLENIEPSVSVTNNENTSNFAARKKPIPADRLPVILRSFDEVDPSKFNPEERIDAHNIPGIFGSVMSNDGREVAYGSDVGNAYVRRLLDEDSLLVRPDLGLFVIGDGMGGPGGGDIASKIAVNAIEKKIEENGALIDSIKDANQAILEEQKKPGAVKDMGTTLTAVILKRNKVQIANIGDSRVYILSPHGIRQITKDHKVVQRLVDEGIITQEEAKNDPRRNRIYRSLGKDSSIDIDFFPRNGDYIELQPDEMILICCDGLVDKIPDDVILGIVKKHLGNPKPALQEIMWLANKQMQPNDGDNVSGILIGPQKENLEDGLGDIGSFKK